MKGKSNGSANGRGVGPSASALSAATPAQALELVKTERSDVIISDIGMPGEDGYAFIRKVRVLPDEIGGQTPAIALTAYAGAEDRVNAARAGFQQHIAKPVEPAELIAVVRICFAVD